MYQLTDNEDCILNVATGTQIPRGHWMWEEYDAWLAQGNTPDPMPTPAFDLHEHVRKCAYAWMDDVVQGKDYDNIYTCASYATSTIPEFKADADALVAWRDAVVLRLYQLRDEPPQGVDSWEEVKPLLPQPEAFGWSS